MAKLFHKTFLLSILGPGLLLSSCGNGPDSSPAAEPLRTVTSQGHDIPVFDFDAIEPLFRKNNDTLYIYNFWATWCVPCIKEMPYFEDVNESYSDKKVRVILVNLDYSEEIESKLIPYMVENDIRSRVVNLDDQDANSWIPKVDPEWDGAIPATLMKKNNRREFITGSLTHKDLLTKVNEFLNY
jgi:thiol-disulfide isomerase/thioredoxin